MPRKPSPKSVARIRLERYSSMLACQLTDQEVMTAGGELARCIRDIEAEDARQSQIRADLKSSMTALEARRSTLAIKVDRREEYREVPCEKQLDRTAKTVHFVRLDTGAELDSRPANDDELQAKLPLEA